MIVGLLLTYGEFRSRQAYARRQYQCLTPDEVQRVGGAQRLLAFLDFTLSRGAGEPRAKKILNFADLRKHAFVVSRQRRPKARREGDTGRPVVQHSRAKDNKKKKVDSYSLVH